jgi:hypothetical protein
MVKGDIKMTYEYHWDINPKDPENIVIYHYGKRMFVETKFYPIGHESKTKSWLINNYGRSAYPITWWTTFDSVYVREDIYTHYKLCE